MRDRTLPLLVLLPGMDGTGRMFGPLLSALPQRVSTVVVAYPPDRPLGYAGLLPLVRDAIPQDGPCILLGESFSGPLALMAARDGAVRGVILCASFIESPVPRFLSRLACLVNPATVRLVPWCIRRRAILRRNGSTATRALLETIRGSVSPAVMAARVRSILALDGAAALRACPVPILYLAAAHDTLVTRKSLARIVRIRPDADVVTINGPHLLLQEAPAAAAGAIVKFIGEVADLPDSDAP